MTNTKPVGKTLFFLIAFFCLNPINAQTKNLERFLHEGLRNSPLLMEVTSHAERNRLDSLLLKATSGFQVGAVSSNTFAPVIKGWGYGWSCPPSFA